MELEVNTTLVPSLVLSRDRWRSFPPTLDGSEGDNVPRDVIYTGSYVWGETAEHDDHRLVPAGATCDLAYCEENMFLWNRRTIC